MEIKYIITKRYYNAKVSFFHLVFEWEDIFKEMLHAKLCFDTEIKTLSRYLGWLFKVLPIGTREPSFVFEMTPHRQTDHRNRANIIPCIIDFYLSSQYELDLFYQYYSKHKLILISSLEAYNFLKSKGCPLNVGHLPLSISDKYRISISTTFKKTFDVLIMGRVNSVLKGWLDQYIEKRPETSVVTCRIENGHYNYYNQYHEFIGNADSREGCIELMKKSKIGLYSTKGMDQDFEDAKGFAQVTPRFLEYIATGNHIIARYRDNEDTDYYEIGKICPHTRNYEEFEEQMNNARNKPVDIKLYADYLEKHYTSVRVKLLKDMLKDLQ